MFIKTFSVAALVVFQTIIAVNPDKLLLPAFSVILMLKSQRDSIILLLLIQMLMLSYENSFRKAWACVRESSRLLT